MKAVLGPLLHINIKQWTKIQYCIRCKESKSYYTTVLKVFQCISVNSTPDTFLLFRNLLTPAIWPLRPLSVYLADQEPSQHVNINIASNLFNTYLISLFSMGSHAHWEDGAGCARLSVHERGEEWLFGQLHCYSGIIKTTVTSHPCLNSTVRQWRKLSCGMLRVDE